MIKCDNCKFIRAVPEGLICQRYQRLFKNGMALEQFQKQICRAVRIWQTGKRTYYKYGDGKITWVKKIREVKVKKYG